MISFDIFYKSVFSFLLILFIFLLHKGVFNTWTSARSLSFVSFVLRTDKEDIVKGDIRWEINQKAIDVFIKHPIFGIGLGNFKKNYHEFEIHNTYLSILTEAGVIGFLSLFLLILYLFYVILKHKMKQILELSGILGCVLLYNWVHYVLRERWVWLFFIFFVIYCLFKKGVDT